MNSGHLADQAADRLEAASIARLYLSGSVRRYHANVAIAPFGQTNADHQCRATQLLLALNPEASPALVYATLHHDVGEVAAGDLPQPFKAASPELARAHAAIEGAMARDILGRTMPYLTKFEREWLKLVDRLEAICFVLFSAPHEHNRPRSGWAGDVEHVLAAADALGCRGKVWDLLADLREGRW